MKTFLFASAFVLASVAAGAAQGEPFRVRQFDTGVSVLSSKEIVRQPLVVEKSETEPAKRQNSYVRPNKSERAKRYFNSMFGPMALGKRVLSSGYGTWRNSPEEWGPTWEGFGRRFASSTGKSVIKNTIRYGLEEAFKLDSRFYRSTKKDFGSRLGNALISPFTARTREGKRVLGFPRLVGGYTASIVAAETWYPDRYSWKNGVRSATTSLAFTAAFNVFKEFVWK